MRLILWMVLASFMVSCKPEQKATEYNLTVSPQAGKNAGFETQVNTPIEIYYEIEDAKNSIALELFLFKGPQYGNLTDCKKTNLTMTCIYTPGKNFTGEDIIYFQTKDGDFKSEKVAFLTILVSPCSPASTCEVPVIPEVKPPTIDTIVDNCEKAKENGTLLVQESQILFPAVSDRFTCDFNDQSPDNDASHLNAALNGPRKDGSIRARLDQEVIVALPSSSVICDMKFKFPEAISMKYDDEIFLNVNDYVLMASQNVSTENNVDGFENGLKFTEDGLLKYKWLGENSLYNLPYIGNGNLPRYCLGVDLNDPLVLEKCNIPVTETVGTFKLDIPSEEIIKLGIANEFGTIESNTKLKFNYISTGDNDNGDCERSSLSFDITVNYIIPR